MAEEYGRWHVQVRADFDSGVYAIVTVDHPCDVDRLEMIEVALDASEKVGLLGGDGKLTIELTHEDADG